MYVIYVYNFCFVLYLGNGLLMSLVDTRSWQGGSTVVGEPSALSTDTLRNITPSNTNTTTTTPTRRNMGGRRPNKDKSVSNQIFILCVYQLKIPVVPYFWISCCIFRFNFFVIYRI